MKLIACRDCGSTVSKRAKSCPNCGAPVGPRQYGCVSSFLVIGVVIYIILHFFGGQQRPNRARPQARPPRPQISEAEQKKKDAEEAAAQAEVDKANREALSDTLADMEVEDVIASVSVDGQTATLTVVNEWHVFTYQIRFQAAQNLWKIWADIASPGTPDHARLSLVDFNGNEVGGSRVWAGSLIWVQEK